MNGRENTAVHTENCGVELFELSQRVVKCENFSWAHKGEVTAKYRKDWALASGKRANSQRVKEKDDPTRE